MYQIYNFDQWQKYLKIPQNELINLVRKFDWKRGLPGGWLVYAPPRCVTAYGDGSLYNDEGRAREKLYNQTAWRASTPASYCTSAFKTAPLPNKFISSGIMKAMRDLLRKNGVMVTDTTCTGMWCNYYERPADNIAGHTDDEDYYQKNYQRETVFVSFTIYEDELFDTFNLARFQIMREEGWRDIPLPHLSLMIMSGSCEHRVLKANKDTFRPRYNITFRTPVSKEEDLIKNYRFFSNFGRYYRQAYILYVPPKAFLQLPPKNTKLEYKGLATAKDSQGNRYKLNMDNSYTSKAIKYYSEYDYIYLQLNTEKSREDLLNKLEVKSAPATTTNEALEILIKQEILYN